jgi:serine/threonine-protein kinase
MKQKGQVRRDQLREAQRLQMEFSRYGLIVTLLELLRRTGSITWQQQQEIERMDFARIVQQADWKGQTIPGYRLRSRIASGGFAAIWTAETLFERREVAVKVLHPERAKDPRAVARFEWEAMLLRRLNCPYIVRGLDHGFERGQHYLVMEYVDGRSLGQLLSETGAFPIRNALSAARQVGEALRYLHREGYLHRDVKPDNAIIDGKERVKLCDLGFAVPIPQHAADGPAKATAVGTAGYISPEAMRGETDVKVGADIYSLGILLYALLTGHEPFEGASSEEVVTNQIESGMPVPNLMLVDAPPVVVLFLKRLMHPDRTKRFPSVVDVLTAMDQLLTVL